MTLNGPTRIAAKLGGALLGAFMLLTLVVPAPTADARHHGSTPCPNYSIQDVHNDPNSDWDGDTVSNSDELYNGYNPCIRDTGAFCAAGGNALCRYPNYVVVPVNNACNNAVATNPNGDYDGDGIANATEVRNWANPCSHPCPNPTNADIALNPNGDWDGDRVSNAVEVSRGTGPCVINSATYYTRDYNPCPYWNHAEARAMPNLDWDGDGWTNAYEVANGWSPCTANYTHIQAKPKPAPYVSHVQTKRLPHVNYTPPKLPAPVCPQNYPYFHKGNGLCYANPVTNYIY